MDGSSLQTVPNQIITHKSLLYFILNETLHFYLRSPLNRRPLIVWPYNISQMLTKITILLLMLSLVLSSNLVSE